MELLVERHYSRELMEFRTKKSLLFKAVSASCSSITLCWTGTSSQIHQLFSFFSKWKHPTSITLQWFLDSLWFPRDRCLTQNRLLQSRSNMTVTKVFTLNTVEHSSISPYHPFGLWDYHKWFIPKKDPWSYSWQPLCVAHKQHQKDKMKEKSIQLLQFAK